MKDVLKVEPSIQVDIYTILCRLRKHNIVITSDVAKIYRMINIVEHERNLQRIIWREHENDELEHYQLNTVTYVHNDN